MKSAGLWDGGGGKVGWRSLQEKGCGKLAGAVGLRLCFKNASMMREGMLRKVLALGEERKEESGVLDAGRVFRRL